MAIIFGWYDRSGILLQAQLLLGWQKEWPVTQNYLSGPNYVFQKISPIKTQTLCLLVAAL